MPPPPSFTPFGRNCPPVDGSVFACCRSHWIAHQVRQFLASSGNRPPGLVCLSCSPQIPADYSGKMAVQWERRKRKPTDLGYFFLYAKWTETQDLTQMRQEFHHMRMARVSTGHDVSLLKLYVKGHRNCFQILGCRPAFKRAGNR